MCPCANSATSPSTARDRAISRSTLAPTLRRLAARASVPEDQPAGHNLVDLLGRQSLVLAVVPLGQIGVDDRLSAEARQFAGFSRSVPAKHEPKHVTDEHRPHPLHYTGGHCRRPERSGPDVFDGWQACGAIVSPWRSSRQSCDGLRFCAMPRRRLASAGYSGSALSCDTQDENAYYPDCRATPLR
jgi:hypothetical protein